MADITIPDIDDALMARLEERARQHDHSVEDEVRQMLTRATEIPSEDELMERARQLNARDGEPGGE